MAEIGQLPVPEMFEGPNIHGAIGPPCHTWC